MEKTPHQQMVTALVKPGADILASLTPSKCNLIHMTWGITGEFLEIQQAFGIPGPDNEINQPNLREEVGDLEFFCEGVMQEMGWEYSQILLKSISTSMTVPLFTTFLDAIEEFSDTMKKHLMYNKPLTDKQTENLAVSLGTILACNKKAMVFADITREEALEANMQKLTKGDTARYKTGSYSDQQAQDRADKAGE